MAIAVPRLNRPYQGQRLRHNFILGVWRVRLVDAHEMWLEELTDDLDGSPRIFSQPWCVELTEWGEIPESWSATT